MLAPARRISRTHARTHATCITQSHACRLLKNVHSTFDLQGQLRSRVTTALMITNFQMFALARQFQALIGADGDLEIPDCDYSYNKDDDYNGYDGGFVVNVSPRTQNLPCTGVFKGDICSYMFDAYMYDVNGDRTDVEQYNLYDEPMNKDNKYDSKWSTSYQITTCGM